MTGKTPPASAALLLRDKVLRGDDGFAIEIKDDTDLGLAILIADLGTEGYLPIAVVVSINEAREIAGGDMAGRDREMQAGGSPLLPECYSVWARGLDGDYREVRRLMP